MKVILSSWKEKTRISTKRSLLLKLLEAHSWLRKINQRQMKAVRTNHRPEGTGDQFFSQCKVLTLNGHPGKFPFSRFLRERGKKPMQVWNVRMKENNGRRPRSFCRELERGYLLLESEVRLKTRWRTRWRLFSKGGSMTLERSFESFKTTVELKQDVFSSCW